MLKRYSQYSGGTGGPLVITWPGLFLQGPDEEARINLALPLDDRTATEILTIEYPAPAGEPQRDRYVYYPGTAPVPEGVAANVPNRFYKILANVEITASAFRGRRCRGWSPTQKKRVEQFPLSGVSMKYTFDAKADAPPPVLLDARHPRDMGGRLESCRRACAVHRQRTFRPGSVAALQRASNEDRSESTDLAKQYPDKLEAEGHQGAWRDPQPRRAKTHENDTTTRRGGKQNSGGETSQ